MKFDMNWSWIVRVGIKEERCLHTDGNMINNTYYMAQII